MKLNIFALTMLLSAAGASASTQEQSYISSQQISAVDSRVNVSMTIDLKALDVKSRQACIITPMLTNGADTLLLDQIGVYGRSRYIQHQRGNDDALTPPATVIKASDAKSSYSYSASVPYSNWMDGATLSVSSQTYGCAGCAAGKPATIQHLAFIQAPKLNLIDALVYVTPPVATEKVRTLSGRANVEFAVNKTDLKADFRNNYSELQRIRAGIDSVRSDNDVTIKSITIKGFASPEGSYASNERLAKGRTEAVKRYVEQLYSFPASLLATDYQPEDWDGLRAWVEASNIGHKDELLQIINNTGLQPDARDAKLRSAYPAEYATLLNTVYPSLRHTDYAIEYTVRAYSDPKEILQIMKTRPGNLDLNEFYIAASSLPAGSEEFNNVFDTAAHLYPNDPVANLNAANAAMAGKDIAKAEKLLAKAGDSPEAIHARGVLATIKGDYQQATQLLQQANSLGIAQSQELLNYISAASAFSAPGSNNK